MSFGKKILGLTALLLMAILWGGYFYVFQENRGGQLGAAVDNEAWCGAPPVADALSLGKDQLTLRITNNLRGEFMLGGSIIVSERTFNRYDLGRNELRLRLRLEPLQWSYGATPIFLEQVRIKPLSRNLASDNKSAYAELESRPIGVQGRTAEFPFDTYRYGYKPVLYYLKGTERIDLRFRHITTLMQMSNTFMPMQKYNRVEYINEKSPQVRDEDYKPYATNECAFSVERKGSFKLIVLLLLLVVCLPLMHVFYRDEPGIDFLATLVGIGAIRVMLVGPLQDFQLYTIDFLFSAVILLVGTVSLIKAMRANSRRELAAKSGSSW
ncbi:MULTISPECIES: hypothetical protein [unclassified Pseudomonas]|uniref:hypothetical protein n=1 Tax=unclassified Pseudomonas TaxID=196821 RepID=UPI002AC9BF66|nr:MULTISPECIES: hypothetical protein [unclassified Pseudomonas]MEB0048277.1 hypothetical protein [Pseudomonas sp. Dout3]MEB0099230.1 hypothetical protein [Pseudomonas sp. DC1.2]WPX61204.1 hypothetical protein RHM68_11385 [Pseudomonas sp. DC1.2]